MNQIAKVEQRKSALAMGGKASGIVPTNIEEAFRLSDAINQSGMAPYGLDTPQKIMIAMLAGMELGMPAMQSVQSVAVINNRPCIWGDALIGVIRSSRDCEYVKEWIDGEGDSMVAWCETKRRGEDEPVRKSFSVDDAKRAGLWQTQARVTKQGRNGSYEKDNDSPWYKYPKRMLQMRARAWCLRDTYADILKGMQVREEVEDYSGANHAKDVTPQGPSISQRLTAAREASQEPQDEREGFDLDHVTRETETRASEAHSNEEHQSDASPSQTIASDDPASPHLPDNGDDGKQEEGSTPSSSPIRECAVKILGIAVDPLFETPQQRRAALEQSKDDWKAELPADDHDKLKSLVMATDAVIKGNQDYATAVEFFAEQLGMTIDQFTREGE